MKVFQIVMNITRNYSRPIATTSLVYPSSLTNKQNQNCDSSVVKNNNITVFINNLKCVHGPWSTPKALTPAV